MLVQQRRDAAQALGRLGSAMSVVLFAVAPSPKALATRGSSRADRCDARPRTVPRELALLAGWLVGLCPVFSSCCWLLLLAAVDHQNAFLSLVVSRTAR